MRFGKWALLSIILGSLALSPAFAADDPSIQGKLRKDIQKSMSRFIDQQTVDGVFRIYDPVTDELLHLTLKELHSGIVKKGDFYVSCADFTDPAGNVVDLDFLVVPDGKSLKTTQAIVHKVDGKKRPYHLE